MVGDLPPLRDSHRGAATPRAEDVWNILTHVVEPADDFDDASDEGWSSPLLPPEDRLWRHPSELGEHAIAVSAEALSARRSWMAASPSRAGAWSAGIVGALLATGVVLIGGHLTHLLSPSTNHPATISVNPNLAGTKAKDPATSGSTLAATTTTVSSGPMPDLYDLAVRVAPAMPMVFVDHKPSGVGIVVSPKGYVLVPAALLTDTDTDDIGLFIDGQQLPATLVGIDPGTGLAVVRVHAMSSLTSVSFASDTAIGYGSFVALVWVDGAGTHACWGSVSSLDAKLTTSDGSPALLESLDTLEPPGGVATGGVIVDGAGRLIGMVTGATGNALIATRGDRLGRHHLRRASRARLAGHHGRDGPAFADGDRCQGPLGRPRGRSCQSGRQKRRSDRSRQRRPYEVHGGHGGHPLFLAT
jgi:S1-C subfamily serine protease